MREALGFTEDLKERLWILVGSASGSAGTEVCTWQDERNLWWIKGEA